MPVSYLNGNISLKKQKLKKKEHFEYSRKCTMIMLFLILWLFILLWLNSLGLSSLIHISRFQSPDKSKSDIHSHESTKCRALTHLKNNKGTHKSVVGYVNASNMKYMSQITLIALWKRWHKGEGEWQQKKDPLQTKQAYRIRSVIYCQVRIPVGCWQKGK